MTCEITWLVPFSQSRLWEDSLHEVLNIRYKYSDIPYR